MGEYRVHEEAKSVGAVGEPCTKRTHGLLDRRAVTMLGKPKHVGKESNKLEDRMIEQFDAERDYLNIIDPADWSHFRLVTVPAGIKLDDTAKVAETANISRRVVQKAFAGARVRESTERAIAQSVARIHATNRKSGRRA